MGRCRAVPALFAALWLSSCFQQPVRERLHLDVQPDGTLLARLDVRIARVKDDGSAAFRARLDATRKEYDARRDRWSRTFERLEPAAEQYGSEHESGDLVRVTRAALLEHPRQLATLFEEGNVSVSWKRDGTAGELEFVPGAGSGATQRQRQQFDDALGAFVPRVVVYYRALDALYRRMAEDPGIGRLLLFDALDPFWGETPRPPGSLSDEDGALLEAFREARDEVLQVVSWPKEGDLTIEELSRVVHDPFPAEVSVTLPVAPEEAEGFLAGPEERQFNVPVPSLWAAIVRGSARWADPDLAVLVVEHGRRLDDPGPLPFDAIAATPKRATVPSAREVRETLDEGLRPRPRYRLRWTVEATDGS